MVELKAGDNAPSLSLKDQDGKTVSLADFEGRGLLLYLHPKADTPGCTKQACSVRDAVTEVPSSQGDRFGIDRLRDVIRSAVAVPLEEGLDAVLSRVRCWAGGEALQDDVSLLALEVEYDWVMVPNVYGMSQYADGGRITTKPYISSSNDIRRMSNFGRGDWCEIWDGLFWRFISKHKRVFAANPRMRVMAAQVDRMGRRRLKAHVTAAERFLERLLG